jgi:hypothetical protein
MYKVFAQPRKISLLTPFLGEKIFAKIKKHAVFEITIA